MHWGRSNANLTTACAVVVAVVALAVMITRPAAKSKERRSGSPNSSTTQNGDILCGPRAFYYSALRLGVMVDAKDLVRKLEVSQKGVSMLRLKKLAKQYGLAATGEVLTWDSLKKLNGVAILYIRKNHFVCADPREKFNEAGADVVRIYDEEVAEWWDQKRLEGVWSGEALTLQLAKAKPRRRAPYARFDTLLQDVGARRAGALVTALFPLENWGSMNLEVKGVKTSCSCAGATVTQPVLHPGERAAVTVHVDLSEKRGPFETYAVVLTNDPLCHAHKLTVQGRTLLGRLVTERRLVLGEMTPGTTTTQCLVVHDPGDGTLQIRNCIASIAPADGRTLPRGMLATKTSWRQWESGGSFETSSAGRVSRGQPGDIIAQAEVSVGQECSPGPASGELEIVTNQSGDSQRFVIPLWGYIQPGASAKPPALLIVFRDGADEEITRRIFIESSKGAGIIAVDTGQLPITTYVESPSKAQIIVSCKRSMIAPGTTQGLLSCSLSDGNCVEIPCLLVRTAVDYASM